MLEGFLRLGMLIMMAGWQMSIVKNWNLFLSYCALNIIYFSLGLFNADEIDVAIEYVYHAGCIHFYFMFSFLSCFSVYYCTNFMLNK